MGELLFLLGLFAVKHMLADYHLQPAFLSRAKRYNWKALLFHSWIHASITSITLFALVTPVLENNTHPMVLVLLPWFDFVSHATIDFSKIRVEKYMNRTYKEWPKKTLLVIDQILHGICYLIMIYVILRYSVGVA
jgi:hypothetical protein